jgi:hypothetical protein
VKFKEIQDQEDIQELMIKFGYFHDSCIKEIYYISGGYVGDNRAMYPINSDRTVHIIFQSQAAEYSVIEMKFNSINKLNLVPRNDDCDCIIYDASLIKIDYLFYWSEWVNFGINDIDKEYGTWISAEKVSWRPLSDSFLENNPVYKMNEE